MSGRGFESEILYGTESLRALEPAWDALWASGDHEPSISFEWVDALLDTHLGEDDEILTVVVKEAGRCVAIVPVMMRPEKIAGALAVTTVSPVAELYPTRSDILGDRGRPEVIAAMWHALEALPRPWQMFRLRRVLESSPLARGISGFVETSGRQHRIRREYASYEISLENGFAAYLESRSAKFRNHLRRRARQLEAAGSIEIRRVGKDLELEAGYRDLLAVEERSWKHAHGTAITVIPRQREFYRRLCAGALRRNRLQLALMYLDRRPIAFNLGYERAGRYHYLKSSYDASMRELGAATVFRAKLLEMLAAEGVRFVDFPGEPYQWEAQWARTLRWNSSVLIFNRSIRGSLCRWLVGTRDLFRARASAEQVRFYDPRALGPDSIHSP